SGDVEVLRAHRIADLAPSPPALDQARSVEHGQVLRHRLARERQLGGQRRRRHLTGSEDQIQHAAPRGVGDGLEKRVIADPVPGHSRAAGFVLARSRNRPRHSCHPLECSSAYFALSSSDQSIASNPLSTTRRRVLPFSGSSKNSTSSELSLRRTRPGRRTQRKAKRRGGSTASTCSSYEPCPLNASAPLRPTR